VRSIAEEIVAKDKTCDNLFANLELLNEPAIDDGYNLQDTVIRYFNYLKSELGEIQFEGLPTDKDAGSIRIKLENIFVPLHLTNILDDGRKNKFPERAGKRLGIGEVLSQQNRLAILAKPGGGKSTLIKRIAMAYAFPERRREINDALPDKPWFPIFLRCRELGDRVTLSITEIIESIPTRAELSSQSKYFMKIVSEELQKGTALLLIDGLDEISDDRNRIAFVSQLRTFIATFPTINIIVTSREAGFRVVGGSLATYCSHFKVSNLNEAEIEQLSVKWHQAIIDDSPNTIKEAQKLSEVIIADPRIKVLAENPLLLTTLLFVKRWAGYIPTKKTVLYQEMIKLLLVTWNVQGHDRLDIEEAEPQLAFTAYWMTKNGQQTISEDDLQARLVDSRKQMPEILEYTNVSPAEFVKRVEFRSSLLIMSGHKRLESGHLAQIYEFLHLSFQEYLTAKAIVKKYIPIDEAAKKTVDLLKPNIESEIWKEIIPITAVLLERDTKDLIENLISRSKGVAQKQKDQRTKTDKLAPSLLGNCLANEIQISPELLAVALEWYIKNTYVIRDRTLTYTILKSKFGSALRLKTKELFFSAYDDQFASELGSTIGEIFIFDLDTKDSLIKVINRINDALKDPNDDVKCEAILGLMSYSFDNREGVHAPSLSQAPTEEIFNKLLLLFNTSKHFHFAVCWCVAWSIEASIFPSHLRKSYIDFLVKPWMRQQEPAIKRVISWALSKLILPNYDPSAIINIPKLKAFITTNSMSPTNEFDKAATFYLGKTVGVVWSEDEINDFFKSEMKSRGSKPNQNHNKFLFAHEFGIDLNAIKTE
jgi:hypothetical protein